MTNLLWYKIIPIQLEHPEALVENLHLEDENGSL